MLALGLLSTPTKPRLEGMEKFRGRSFHTYDWPHEPVTVSIGAAQATHEEEPAHLVARADAALYRAKHEGRNRVVLDA